MTRAAAAAAYRTAAIDHDASFDDRFPTQPIPVAHRQVGRVHDDRCTRAPDATHGRVPPPHRRPPASWQPPAAPAGSAPHRTPPRPTARRARSTILVAVAAAVIAATVGVVGHESWTAWSPSHEGFAPATGPGAAARQAEDAPRRQPPPGDDVRDRDARGAVGRADGVVPDGVTVFDDEFPAVAKLDPGLLIALRRAAKDAADDGVELNVNSGWRSREYQDQLLREAVSEYGSETEAARWVATPDTSTHVSGDGVDIGPPTAAAWLSEHGADYGLCQIYRNEPWHYELRADAVDRGCPRMYADPTHDPRMQK